MAAARAPDPRPFALEFERAREDMSFYRVLLVLGPDSLYYCVGCRWS
jgi:hypothetical protein